MRTETLSTINNLQTKALDSSKYQLSFAASIMLAFHILVHLFLIQSNYFVKGSCDSFSLGECTDIDSVFYENDKVYSIKQSIF